MNMRLIIGAAIGAVLGFAAYKFIGCVSGACPLTSNPWVSTLLGLGLGAMVTGSPARTNRLTNAKEDWKSK